MKPMGLILYLLANLIPDITDCTRVKTGKFLLRDKMSGETIIYRTASIQREENIKFGIITEDSIKWINDCTYRLVPYRIIKNDSNIPMGIDLKLEIQILEIKEMSYTQMTTSLVTGESATAEVMIASSQ